MRHAIHRAIPWRYLLTLIGTIAALGGGIVAVSTPVLGGGIFTFGVLALIAGATE
jgi:hypothetical protein